MQRGDKTNNGPSKCQMIVLVIAPGVMTIIPDGLDNNIRRQIDQFDPEQMQLEAIFFNLIMSSK